MTKLMIIGRRAPGRSRAAAHAHLRTVHGPMVVRPPADAGPMPVGYVQNHVLDGAYPPSSDPRLTIERDLVTELWFDSIDHMRSSVQTPYYLANLRPDEPRFVDDATVERLLVEQRTVRDGDAGTFKLFLFGPAEMRQDRLDALHGAQRICENLVHPGPFGQPLAELVLEAWYPDMEAAATALDAVPGLAMLAREYSSDALRRG